MNNKAFTLIEVLIALVLLAFGLLALAQMQITAIREANFMKGGWPSLEEGLIPMRQKR